MHVAYFLCLARVVLSASLILCVLAEAAGCLRPVGRASSFLREEAAGCIAHLEEMGGRAYTGSYVGLLANAHSAVMRYLATEMRAPDANLHQKRSAAMASYKNAKVPRPAPPQRDARHP